MDIQQSLFSQLAEEQKLTKGKHHWTLFVDGASRNNPGKAGAGIYLVKDGQAVKKDGFFLGIKTNNEAEYLALLIGLFFVRQYVHASDTVRVVSDSELLVKHIKGEYRVKKAELKPLHKLAHTMLHEINGHIVHVLRTENHVADEMANFGIDTKKIVPPQFAELLKHHGISF